MKAEPKQQRARLKRQALIDAAAKEFGERGYEQSTAKSIAARAQVATGSFYQHFDNKDELLRLVAEQRLHSIDQQLVVPGPVDSQAPGQTLDVQALFKRALAYVYDFHARDPQLHEVLEQRRCVDAELNALMSEREARLLEKVVQFVSAFNLPDTEAVAFSLHAMAEGLVHRHVFHPNSIDREQLLRCGAAMLSAYFERLQTEKSP